MEDRTNAIDFLNEGAGAGLPMKVIADLFGVAYAESLFKTMKYHQSYPMRRFRNLDTVRFWIESFVEWYNSEHRHSGIKYVTPNQRHFGEADAICAVRQQTYSKDFMENPRRWSRPPRCCKQPESVKINYPRLGK